MKSLSKLCAALIVVFSLSGFAFATDVTFQVDMSFQETLGNFDPETMTVQVRGGFNEWAGDDMTDSGESIYTVTLAVDPGDYEYKFVYVEGENVTYEGIDNRLLTVGDEAMVLEVVYFSDQEPVETANVEVLFQVNMSIKILQGGFDPAVDLVVVRGNHDNIGNWGGAVALTLDEDDIYTAWIQFDNLPIDAPIEYKFVVLANGDENQADWEASANRSFTPTGTEADNDENGYGEIIPEVVYFADVGPEDIITQDLMVIYSVDCRPPYYMLMDVGYLVDIQTTDTLRIADIGIGDGNIGYIDIAGASPLSWDWGSIPEENRAHDDGLGQDEVAGDSVFTVGIQYYAGDPNRQEWKCGVEGFDCEAGFAMNHNNDFEDTGGEFVIEEQFGSQDTLYTQYFEYAVREVPSEVLPGSFILEQNYPNPFNPTTQIAFNLPERADVVVKVFNVTGREVFRQNAGNLNAGCYSITFEAKDIASGPYFYRVEAGKYSATKQMILLK